MPSKKLSEAMRVRLAIGPSAAERGVMARDAAFLGRLYGGAGPVVVPGVQSVRAEAPHVGKCPAWKCRVCGRRVECERINRKAGA